MITLLNGDCLDKLKDISSNSVDCIICDLPFGCLAQGGGKDHFTKRVAKDKDALSGECSWDIKINLEAFWKEIKRIRRNDATPTLHFCTTKFGFDLYNSNPKEFRYDLVWDKGRGVSFLLANKMPMRSHEMVYVFSKDGAYYKRVDISGNFLKYERKGKMTVSRQFGVMKVPHAGGDGVRCALSIIKQGNCGIRGGHPTEKPVELYKFLLSRFCPEGGTVLDPTFGSGNSGLAAKELGLHYIGIEKNQKYYDAARKKMPDSVETLP